MVIAAPIAPAVALVVALAIVVFALAIAIALSIPGAVRRAAANVAIAVVALPSFGVTAAMAGMEYTLIALIVAALIVVVALFFVAVSVFLFANLQRIS